MKRHIYLISALLFVSLPGSFAQAAVTFGASVTNANGTLSTTLSWNAPGASGCIASGHPSWTGDKPASGSLELPAITMSGTYSLTLACTTPGNGAATVVRWTVPTTNTDGSALTNLAGFRVRYGRSATTLDQTRQVATPTANNTSIPNLAAGAWFFAVVPYNANNVEGELSNLATKTITATAVENASVTLTVNPKPNPATGVTAE